MDDLRLTRLETTVERHDSMLRGNGTPGLIAIARDNSKQLLALDERLDGIAASQSALKASVDGLVGDHRDRDQQRLGQVKLFNSLRTILIVISIVVGIGAPLGMWRINTQFTQVQNQLQRIPALPE